MSQKLSNNGRALLTSSILAIDTALTVQAGKADSFPVANTSDWLTPADWFRASIEDSSGNIEVIKVGTRTSGSGVMSVILRGQEGTAARAFPVGSVVEQRFTKLDIETIMTGTFENISTPGTATIGGKLTHNGIEGRITPVGGIILYQGAVVDIPDGWQLCDGTNGTIDMRDKFIIGAGGTYAVGATGGSKDAIAVTHSHTGSFTGAAMSGHAHGVVDPGHAHSVAGTFLAYGQTPNVSGVLVASGSINTGVAATGVSISGASAGTPSGTITVDSGGASGTDKNMPPYYALAYIRCMEY